MIWFTNCKVIILNALFLYVWCILLTRLFGFTHFRAWSFHMLCFFISDAFYWPDNFVHPLQHPQALVISVALYWPNYLVIPLHTLLISHALSFISDNGQIILCILCKACSCHILCLCPLHFTDQIFRCTACMTSHTHGFRIFMGFSSPTGHRAEGLLHLDFLSSTFLHNLKPCDWSDCPKARLPLVETGSNVSEEDQVWVVGV